MKEFPSLGAMGLHLLERAVAVPAALQAAHEAIGRAVERTAKSEMGVYQEAVGGFPAWDELADSTKDSRVAAGYTENDPLKASGDLQASVSHEASILEVVIGTPAPQMPFLEFGTSKMPPRPVFGPAAFRNKEKIEAIAGVAGVTILVGDNPVHAMAYDFETKD